MLTVSEAAKRLRCSPALVYLLCSEGKLRHIRVGLKRGAIRIEEDALLDFVRQATIAEKPKEPRRFKHLV